MTDTTKEAVAPVEEVTTEVTEGEGAPGLTVQDLANMRNIIDIASQRGAFKTEEFTVVGATYTKLANFVAAVTPAEDAAEAPAAEAPAAEAPADAPAEA